MPLLASADAAAAPEDAGGRPAEPRPAGSAGYPIGAGRGVRLIVDSQNAPGPQATSCVPLPPALYSRIGCRKREWGRDE